METQGQAAGRLPVVQRIKGTNSEAVSLTPAAPTACLATAVRKGEKRSPEDELSVGNVIQLGVGKEGEKTLGEGLS